MKSAHGSPGWARWATVAVLLPVLCHGAYGEDEPRPDEIDQITATATIVSCDSQGRIGRASLRERPSAEGVKTVDVEIDVRRGLRVGNHAVHIHETGACEPCSAAGGHFDPGPHGNTSPDGNHPFHAGDLVNLKVCDPSADECNREGERAGGGTLTTLTTRVTLSDGPLTLFDEDGSAFIIHTMPDSYCPGGEVAGCAGGSRAACGVIVKGAVKTNRGPG